jgi:uncharacterized protein YdhG (YjbR/CyaY superfamily)
MNSAVGHLVVAIKAVKILEYVCDKFCRGVLRHTNSNQWKEILMNPGKTKKGFTDEEKGAMKERAKELKAEARANKNKAEGESDVLAKISEMQGSDRAMAKRIHEIIKASAPALSPKTWYGMPAYGRSSSRGTRRSASTTMRTSTKALCGRPPSP